MVADYMTYSPAAVRLKKGEERRLRAGHLWVFSNEVDTHQTPLSSFVPGQLIEIQTSTGRYVGSGYINPHSLICARLLSRDQRFLPNRSLLVHRLKVALSLRERLYPRPFYRLVYGEGDYLPGLVVDRFADVVVAQLTTAGMEAMKEDVVAALSKVLRPQTILFRNDSSVRELEGLPLYVETALGELPEWLEVEENGLHYQVPVKAGQKTGWYYDQRENRARLRRYVQARRVLDLYAYAGGWGVLAANAGAQEVVCVDSSAVALEYAALNASRNDVSRAFKCEKGDVQKVLRTLHEAKEKFDVVILDPPAFIKRRKNFRRGVQAYRHVNRLAQQVLSRDGIMVSCSCSFHLARDQLQQMVLESARHLGRALQVLEQGYQAPDHPIHPAIPETDYLKAIFCRMVAV